MPLLTTRHGYQIQERGRGFQLQGVGRGQGGWFSATLLSSTIS